jgi:hypothetical protein
MRNGLLLLAGAAVLAGCSMEIPDFMGRQSSSGTYNLNILGKKEPLPEPRPVQLRQAVAERALFGVIVRVTAEAPTQGWHTAQMVPVGTGPDKAGILSFQLMALPPASPQPVGPVQTRVLTAAVFIPSITARKLNGYRVAGGTSIQTVRFTMPPPSPVAEPDEMDAADG